MNRDWIICAALAVGTHGLLLFAIRADSLAKPGPIGCECPAVEVSIVEAASAAPSNLPIPAEPPPEPVPPVPPPPDQTPPPPEPVLEPIHEPPPEPTVNEPTPPLRPRSEISKSRVALPLRTTSAPGPPGGRGPTTSERARYRSNPKPNYPAEARRAGQQGVVILAVQVNANGRATSVQISGSSGFPLLDNAALLAVRRWTFEPARIAGIPTESRVEVPVRFDLAR